MIPKRICFSLASLLFLLFFSCKNDHRYEGKKILRFNIAEGISSLDPAFARTLDNVNATKQLFDGLVDLDESLHLIPSIAKKWEILEEGRLYRFYLREDVKFHTSAIFGADSTRSVVAQDFVFSFNRLIDKQLLSPAKWVMNYVARSANGSLQVHAVNDTLLEIRLKQSFPPFLGILSMQYCSVIPHEAFEGNYNFLKHPIGTGAFQFKYWKENGKLVLLKNSNYFQKDKNGEDLPRLDALSISFLRDQEVVFLKFLKGELDFISGLKGSYKDELLNASGKLRLEYQDRLVFLKYPYLNTEYLGFQLGNDSSGTQPLHNLNLRKAINYAIDKSKMLKYLRNDIGYAANAGFIPRGMPPFDTLASYGYEYEPDSARFYLRQFQKENTTNLMENKIVLGTTSEYLDICEYVQHQLQQLGIGVQIEVNQAATGNEMIAFGKIPFFRKSWVADYPDAENYLSLFIRSNFSPSGPNYTHFSDSTYDQLFQKALSISNDSARHSIYLKLDSMIVSQAAIVPLFYDQQVHFKSPKISHFKVNPMSHLMLKYADKIQ